MKFTGVDGSWSVSINILVFFILPLFDKAIVSFICHEHLCDLHPAHISFEAISGLIDCDKSLPVISCSILVASSSTLWRLHGVGSLLSFNVVSSARRLGSGLWFIFGSEGKIMAAVGCAVKRFSARHQSTDHCPISQTDLTAFCWQFYALYARFLNRLNTALMAKLAVSLSKRDFNLEPAVAAFCGGIFVESVEVQPQTINISSFRGNLLALSLDAKTVPYLVVQKPLQRSVSKSTWAMLEKLLFPFLCGFVAQGRQVATRPWGYVELCGISTALQRFSLPCSSESGFERCWTSWTNLAVDINFALCWALAHHRRYLIPFWSNLGFAVPLRADKQNKNNEHQVSTEGNSRTVPYNKA